ncbi:Cytoplasmic tRNA 2-thiolation protein 1-like [Oopsacas minuta]|uniref:Cytoplasmic tRNA 2-thiolation protein 1 n=1 Tax=Oopsacas minuta TaxID=111878 RepID=A0AAV7K0T9_9METZ|nr:Cytoplasmic tRNA 2-thiolation protein 1-like [Oopsacas minuta]
MTVQCKYCEKRAQLKRPKTGHAVCKSCFCSIFEEEVHQVITEYGLFRKGDVVGIGASGGKDSTVLAYVLNELNKRHSYGLKLHLVSVDEGITGYRDDSLQSVKRNESEYAIPLTVVSYKELYGWTMDEIVKEIGRRNNCTFCGVFRRQALDRAALKLHVNKLVTGHNADDIAETVIMNTLRGDIARLQRCTNIVTGSESLEEGDLVPRCKPFKFVYEKEIVLYAYHKKLDYFSTECIYSPNAYRGYARSYIKDLERVHPHAIIDIIQSGDHMTARVDAKMPTRIECTRCHYISSQILCKACILLDGLNSGKPRLSLTKASRPLAVSKEVCSKKDKVSKGKECSGSCGCAEIQGNDINYF